MNLDHKNLSIVVFLTFAGALCLPVLLPSWHLMVFSPLLVILFYQKTYLTCLWWSILCGAFLDLLSTNNQFGIYAVAYGLTTLLLYSQRGNFFADSITTLPLMTFFYSALSTLLQCLLMYIFERNNVFSWDWALTDLLYMPALDAVYGFTCFIVPALFFKKRARRGKDYFLES